MADATGVERWRTIAGYEGYYEVSDHGRVRSLDRTIVCRNGVLKPVHGRILSPGHDQGRLLVNLHGPDGHRMWKVHTLVIQAFVGPRPDGLECLHWDDDATNNHVSNLRWGNRTDNMQDCLRNGHNDRVNRTHCRRRHPLAPPNLVPSELKKGRKCMACSRAHSMASNRVRQGVVAMKDVDMQALSDLYYAEILATGGAPRVRPHWIRYEVPLRT